MAQVLAHFRVQGGLEHGLGLPGQQPSWADELDPVSAGRRHKLLSKLLLIYTSRHRLDRLGHNWSFPQDTPGVRGPVTPSAGHSPIGASVLRQL